MSSVLISNNKYIKGWNILEGSIKPSVIHYCNIQSIKDINFNERERIVSLALLWDNIGNRCSIPFLDSMTLLENKKPPQSKNKSKKIRHGINLYGTRKKCLKYNKKTSRRKRDIYLEPIKIIDRIRSWPSLRDNYKQEKKETSFHKVINVFDYTQKAKKYYSDDLLKTIKIFSQNKKMFTLDLITCNMNNEEFIRQTKEIEKKFKITITYSIDETGNQKSSMGDWIQESHNISIKDKYFNNDILNWKYTLNNLIYNVNDSTNTYNLTASGDVFFISDIPVNTVTQISTLPTNLEIDSSSIVLNGFIDFNFKNSDNTTLDVTNFNMTDLIIEGSEFTNISLSGCNFRNASIKDTSFANINVNNTIFGFINNGGNVFDLSSNMRSYTKLETVDTINTLKTFVIGPNVNLTNVDMTDQNLDGVDFNNANLTGSVINTTKINSTRFVNFDGTPSVIPVNSNIIKIQNSTKNIIIGPHLDITNTNLSSQNLTGFNFTNCSFSGVSLQNTNLTNVILSNTVGGPFNGAVSNLPNANYKILTTGDVNNYLVGSNMVVRTTDFGSFSFENLDISNIDLHSSILSQCQFQNSYIHLIDNSIPTISTGNGYKHIGNNLLGPGLLIGDGPYQDVTIDIDLAGQDITNTTFLNCKLGPFDAISNLPSLDSTKYASVLNASKYYIYGEDLDCTDLDLTDENLTNFSLINATVVNTIFTNVIIKNSKLFNMVGIPANDPANYIFDDLADAYIGPNINYENLLVKNDHMFKIGTGFNDLTGIRSKHISWNNYDISKNYQGGSDQLLPDGMKLKSGMILGRDVDLTNTKRVKTKSNIRLSKNIKYRFKSVVNIPLPYKLQLDVDSTSDISFIFNSTSEYPSQLISETDLSLGNTVTNEQKEQFKLDNIISLTTPSIIDRDLSGNNLQVIENLQGIDFSGSNLSYVDFKLKNLTNCNFTSTILTYTDFSGTTLTNCNFSGATLNLTDFTNTIDISTVLFTIDQSDSTIILENYQTAILPEGVSFEPDFAPGMGNT